MGIILTLLLLQMSRNTASSITSGYTASCVLLCRVQFICHPLFRVQIRQKRPIRRTTIFSKLMECASHEVRLHLPSSLPLPPFLSLPNIYLLFGAGSTDVCTGRKKGHTLCLACQYSQFQYSETVDSYHYHSGAGVRTSQH